MICNYKQFFVYLAVLTLTSCGSFQFSSYYSNDGIYSTEKNITSKGFVRSNYEEKLVDLSDIRLNLKSKN